MHSYISHDSFVIVAWRIYMRDMWWLRLFGSLKLLVSFAKVPCKRDYILQKRPMILRSLLIVATPYDSSLHMKISLFEIFCFLLTQKNDWSEREKTRMCVRGWERTCAFIRELVWTRDIDRQTERKQKRTRQRKRSRERESMIEKERERDRERERVRRYSILIERKKGERKD